jgi:ABC-2 type transport system permease protein
MPALIRTELLALRTIRTPWVVIAAAVVATVAICVTSVLDAGEQGAASIGTAGGMLGVLDATGKGSVVALLLGVLVVAGEFRHETVTTTFLQTPRRIRVLAAKATAAALVGAALGFVNLQAALAVGLPSGAVQPSLLNGDIALRVVGQVLAYPLYGLLGVGLGALLIYQPVAVVLPLAWVLFVEGLVSDLLPHEFSAWSLKGVTAALANAGDYTDVLPVAAGGLVLLGYAALLLLAGTARVVRRDIT